MKAVIGSVVALGLGVGLGWVLFSGGSQDETPKNEEAMSGPTVQSLQAELDAVTEKLKSANKTVRSTTRDADQAKRRIKELEAEVAAASERAAAAGAATNAGSEADAAVDPKDAWKKQFADGPVFEFTDIEEALKEVDWVQTGTDMSAMVGLIEHVVESQMKNEQPRAEAGGRIQQHNGRLVVVFERLKRAGVPGSPLNGPITHPGVMANAIASTLAAAGKPLSDEQMKTLKEIGARYVSMEQKRLAAYDERTQALRKRVDEAQLKAAFYKEAFALLTKDQYTTLSPPIIRGRIRADLFSEGLLWNAGVSGVGAKDNVDLAQKVTDKVAGGLGTSENVSKANIRAVVDNWVAGLPTTVTELKLDEMAQSGTFLAADITRSADHTATLYERFLTELDLDEKQRAGVLGSMGAMMIFRTGE